MVEIHFPGEEKSRRGSQALLVAAKLPSNAFACLIKTMIYEDAYFKGKYSILCNNLLKQKH